jgi:hypothetical protein
MQFQIPFIDKYISEKENLEKPAQDKIQISNDAYAIGEQLDILIKKISEYIRNIKI